MVAMMRSSLKWSNLSLILLVGIFQWSCMIGLFGEAQEYPKYTIPNFFDWEAAGMDHHRTNFCERHTQVASGQINRKDALRGLNISVVLFDYQLENQTHIPELTPGVDVLVLDEVAARAGFTWRDNYARIGIPVGNQTYNDILYWSLGLYDMTGEYYLRTLNRLSEDIIFPEAWYDGSLIMVRRKQQDKSEDVFDLWAFMSPFTDEVWWLLAGTVVVSALVFHIIVFFEETGLSFFDSIFVITFSLTGHYHYDPLGVGSRIIAVSFCLVALMIVAIYTANLASFLIVQNDVQLEAPIVELKDAVTQDKLLCTWQGAASETLLRAAAPNARINPAPSGIGSLEYLYQDRQCDIAVVSRDNYESSYGIRAINQDCELEWVGRTIVSAEASYAIFETQGLCNTLLRDVMDIYLVEMKTDGRYDEILAEVRGRSQTQDCSLLEEEEAFEENKDNTQIDVVNIGGIFILHGSVLVFAVIASIVERKMRHKEEKEEEDELAEMDEAAATSPEVLAMRSPSSSAADFGKLNAAPSRFSIAPSTRNWSRHPRGVRGQLQQQQQQQSKRISFRPTISNSPSWYARNSSRYGFQTTDDLVFLKQQQQEDSAKLQLLLERIEGMENRIYDKLAKDMETDDNLGLRQRLPRKPSFKA